MSTIYISSEELKAFASHIRTTKAEMTSIFAQIQNRMRLMSVVWDSPAGARCMEQFETLLPVFDQYEALIENYCLFLDATAAAYQENEEALTGVMA